MEKKKKIDSVCSLYKELLEAKHSKKPSLQWLKDNCKSQGKLASSKNKSLDIVPMSINTFKEYADKHIDGGFKAINKLRQDIQKNNKPITKRKKSRITEEKAELKIKLEGAVRSRAIMIKAYNELNRITLDALATNKIYQRDYNKHIALYKDIFSLRLVGNDE